MSNNNNSMFQNPKVVKGLSAFTISYAIDNLYFKNNNMNENLMYSSSVAAGILLGQMVGEQVPGFIPDQAGMYNGKTITSRIFELTSGVSSAYVLNKFVMKNDFSGNMMEKIGMIALTDFLSEYLTDYINGNSLAYFQ